MDKQQLIDKVTTTQSLDRNQILGWVNALPTNKNKKPNTYMVGDVLMHPTFTHPYVLLKKRKSEWLCGLLTSDATCDEILEMCESRFFTDSHFTKVLLTVQEPIGQFIAIYQNPSHLKRVLANLTNTLK